MPDPIQTHLLTPGTDDLQRLFPPSRSFLGRQRGIGFLEDVSTNPRAGSGGDCQQDGPGGEEGGQCTTRTATRGTAALIS
ncbi:MAG: hypothetical protein ACP5XB_04310 [Isosphaeraceae bacterium]